MRINKKKVMIIGLDGGTFDLIKPWMEKSYMPNLNRIYTKGVSGELSSTVPLKTLPAWPSFMTGKNPGKHGILGFMSRENGYNPKPTILNLEKGSTLWEILSEYGKKVIVINVPATFPPRRVNGFMITGILTPRGKPFTYPPSLEDELKKEIGEYNVHFSELYVRGIETMIKDLHNTLEKRTIAALYLMKKYQWDFFMIVFSGTDRIQHEFWRLLDPKHPQHRVNESRRYKNIFVEYFKNVDKCIKKILEEGDENTITVVMSDHGARPLYKFINTNNWLREKKMLFLNRKFSTKIKYFISSLGFNSKNAYKFLNRLNLGRIQNRMNPRRFQKYIKIFFLSLANVDWSRTKAFSLGVSGKEIYINLKGREPKGIVNPGKEYEKLRNKLINDLYSWKDPKTGENVVERVFRKEETYSGSLLEQAPDILFLPRYGYEGFSKHEFMSNSIIETSFGISGTHKREGIFMVSGKDIKKRILIENINILDIAPTVLHIMGVPIPEDMDGRVLKEIFEEDSELSKRKIRKRRVHGRKRDEKYKFSEEEEKEIEERLRGLGYL